jgi:predicted nucleic acid-binding protein
MSFMTADKPLALVDTNILVYAFEKGHSDRKEAARNLLRELMADDRLCLSTQVLQELFVTLTRKVRQPCSPTEALAVLEDLSAWPVMTVDVPAIRTAAQLSGQSGLSFWDALIVVAAARSGASVLYTEDLNHGQEILGVRILNLFARA